MAPHTDRDLRLGHPPWDPHGDPIPTSAGEMPPAQGIVLTAAVPGRTVKVVHLEDEPREIYDALLDDLRIEQVCLESTPIGVWRLVAGLCGNGALWHR